MSRPQKKPPLALQGAGLNARALAGLPPTLQAMIKAHPYQGESEDLGQSCWRRLLEAGPNADLHKIFASARAEARRYALRGGEVDEAASADDAIKAIACERAQQRDAVEAVAERLRVGVRQARRIIADQKKKATGQGDLFSGWAGGVA